ncbi:hypothetical protein AVEN_264944-1 [Araneus ventricosus]|uniref:C2H2-type domain-containing protein n=1 Tax=Araneus ventricosus TaxID=182803 RepID=A0A4Y2SCV3_ARAVE|nr:hypothetical protein AVEN_264944-1 [Araneus ventricosus]
MFPFNCQKCSRKSVPAGRPHCLHCGSDPATDIGMCDKFHPTQPKIATPRVVDIASGSINNVVPNDMKTSSTVLVHNRKRNESNDGLITEIQPRKQCRQEICEISDKILSPYCKPGIKNPDFMPETKAARFNMEYDNSPGSSGFRGNENVPDLLGEKFHSGNPLERMSVVLRDEKTFTCRVCDEKIDKHAKIQGGKYIYFCCICRYTSREKDALQMHCDIHCPKKICNFCSKEYTLGDSHDSEHTCNVCEKKFECKTLLDHQSVDHEEYFLTHCVLGLQ